MKVTRVVLVLVLMGIEAPRAEPSFSPKNGCTIRSVTKQKTSVGYEVDGWLIESYDNQGLQILKQGIPLASEISTLEKKAKRSSADEKKLKELREKSSGVKKSADSHRITAFWPTSDLAREKAIKNEDPLSNCPKKVREEGVLVLNKESNLRARCIIKGLDLPSAQEAEALINCFSTIEESSTKTIRKGVDREELQKIIPPFGVTYDDYDLYFATKTIDPSFDSIAQEMIWAFRPKNSSPELHSLDTSDRMGVQCMQRR